MLEVVKLSYFTQNDEVRVLVRSRKDKDSDFEYHVEYIHGCLSPEMKMVVMLYDEGTHGHSVPEEMIFRNSNIRCFIADRLSAYTTIVKDLEEYNLVRACCFPKTYASGELYDETANSRSTSVILHVVTLFTSGTSKYKLPFSCMVETDSRAYSPLCAIDAYPCDA